MSSSHHNNITAWIIVVILLLIGIFDIVTGCYLLVSPSPGLIYGPETIWANSNSANEVTMSLFQRIGILSVHTGIVTVVIAYYSRYKPKLRTVLLLTYMVTGIGLGIYDSHWFAGTYYRYVKIGIGIVFFSALGLQLVGIWNGWWHEENCN